MLPDVSGSVDFNQTMGIVDKTLDSNTIINSDLLIPFVIITIVLGSLFVYYLWKLKKTKQLN